MLESNRLPDVVSFVLVGVCNTLLGLIVIYALKMALGANDLIANAFGYAIGITVSYTLNARWTFAYRGALLPRIWRFLVVVGAAYAGNLATVMAAIHLFHVDGYVAQAIGVGPYAAVVYAGSKLFVFSGRYPSVGNE